MTFNFVIYVLTFVFFIASLVYAYIMAGVYGGSEFFGVGGLFYIITPLVVLSVWGFIVAVLVSVKTLFIKNRTKLQIAEAIMGIFIALLFMILVGWKLGGWRFISVLLSSRHL